MKHALTAIALLGFLAGFGCSSSSKPHDTAMMAMHCSKCDAAMANSSSVKCKCGQEVKVGDLVAKCPSCSVEVRIADCTGTCSKCGTAMSQATVKIKCPKCGGEGEAKGMRCSHCSSADPKN